MNRIYPPKETYNLPKKNVLVLSCMDLRLTDNLVDFLNYDNLHNRYDHFILAGTSLLTSEQKEYFKDGILSKYQHWNKALRDHIHLAADLHKVQDVYVIEHQDCGAYHSFLKDSIDLSSVEKEIEWHSKFSKELAEKICRDFQLNVHCFFIDLRGNVEWLFSNCK
jgi:carbonic anhydrase